MVWAGHLKHEKRPAPLTCRAIHLRTMLVASYGISGDTRHLRTVEGFQARADQMGGAHAFAEHRAPVWKGK